MKRCPECGRNYNDDSMSFCLDDGSELLFGPASDEPATAILTVGLDTREAKTRTFDEREKTGPGSTQSVASGRKFIAVVVAGVVIVSALGIGGYFYYGRDSNQLSSIAVMPFVNASGNADLEYLSDGMTESLMNSLSQLPNLFVKARSSVFRYKGKEVDPVAVGNELGVQAVLNGRVMQRGDQLTLSLDLVDARTGNQIWGEKYERKTDGLAALQTSIARDVSAQLRQRLTGAEQKNIAKNQTQNNEAFQLYLQGRFQWNKRRIDANTKAIEYFQKAIEKDPSYAHAYVGLAECYITGFLPNRERKPKVEAAANKALELDPTLGEPHAVLGVMRTSDHDYAGGEVEFKKAIELSPNYATAYHWYGETLVWLGRFEEGFEQYRKALDLDPLSLAISTDLGRSYYVARQYDRAIEHLEKLIELDPNYLRTYFYLAAAYKVRGMFEESIRATEKGMLLGGEDPQEIAKGVNEVLHAYRTAGPEGFHRTIAKLQEIESRNNPSITPVAMARSYAEAGDRDKAFEWIEKALENGDGAPAAFKVSPEWDNLRDDPRFTEVLKKVGFP